MTKITLNHVSKTFGGVHAISNLSLEIHDKEFFVLLGPTGAGKSTLLRCIAGLESPDQGTIDIGDECVNNLSAAQRDVALVFQQYSLYPNYTVRQNLEFPLKSRLRNYSAQEIAQRVEYAAKTVRITHLLDRRTDKLSGGEMQRVSIGRAIVRNSRVFLMDEPLSNLDAKLRESLRAELKGLQQRLGTTLVFVTHDQVEAMTMGDRVGVIYKGQLVQVGTPYDIYNTPANTFVASFVGSPAINLLECDISPDGRYADGSGVRIDLQAHGVQLSAPHTPERRVHLGIRPEDFYAAPDGPVRGRIYALEHHGMQIIATVEVGAQKLRVILPADLAVATHDEIGLSIRPQKIHVFDIRSGLRIPTTQPQHEAQPCH